jgi:hypothetical protein
MIHAQWEKNGAEWCQAELRKIFARAEGTVGSWQPPLKDGRTVAGFPLQSNRRDLLEPDSNFVSARLLPHPVRASADPAEPPTFQ